MLLYGTREQIVGRLDELRENGLDMTGELDAGQMSQQLDPESSLDFEVRWGASDNLHSTLHIPAPPELPDGLSPGQAAQLSEIFEYLHLQSRTLVQSRHAARRRDAGASSTCRNGRNCSTCKRSWPNICARSASRERSNRLLSRLRSNR